MRTPFGLYVVPVLVGWVLVLAEPAGAQEGSAVAVVGELEGESEGREGDALTFGIVVDPPDGGPAQYEWDFGDGKTLSGSGLSGVAHEYLHGDSTYTVTVRVSLASGTTVSRSRTVEIRNAPPRILTLEVEHAPSLDRPVEFWAEAEDPGADRLEYEWDFGDGSPPEVGEEMREVSHQYAERGRYTVTLTVRDEAEEVVETITVVVGLDLFGQLTGDIVSDVDALNGPVTMFAGFMPFNVGVPPHGVGRLSATQCLISFGFWDDERRIHVNFLWVPEPDRIFHPNDYLVLNSAQVAPGPGMVNAQVHVMTDDAATYERARSEGATADANSNILVAAARVARNWIDGFVRNQGGGNNALLHSAGGSFRILRASPDTIIGEFDIAVPGVRTREERNPEVSVNIDGRFIWRPELESTRTALADCDEPTEFTIASHKPEVEEKGIDFVFPGIEIEFTRPYKPDTVTEENVEVGILNASGEFEAIDGRVTLETDARKVWFMPDEPLLAGVYYHVRIRGGEEGVLDDQEEPLPDDYEWRFLTLPRLVPLARGTG